jgi:predicted kinase
MVLPMLVLLNGIPGSGKSTLARAWTERHPDPLTLAMDIDVVRGMLGRWPDDAMAAGLAARAIALVAIDVHLRAGHDVIVPQYLRRADFIDELGSLASAAAARFVECVIAVDPATAATRLTSRATATVPGPEGVLEESVEAVHEGFTRFLTTRPDAAVIQHATVDSLEAAVQAARSVAEE